MKWSVLIMIMLFTYKIANSQIFSIGINYLTPVHETYLKGHIGPSMEFQPGNSFITLAFNPLIPIKHMQKEYPVLPLMIQFRISENLGLHPYIGCFHKYDQELIRNSEYGFITGLIYKVPIGTKSLYHFSISIDYRRFYSSEMRSAWPSSGPYYNYLIKNRSNQFWMTFGIYRTITRTKH